MPCSLGINTTFLYRDVTVSKDKNKRKQVAQKDQILVLVRIVPDTHHASFPIAVMRAHDLGQGPTGRGAFHSQASPPAVNSACKPMFCNGLRSL